MFHLGRLHGQTMVGCHTGVGVHAFDRVEPVHFSVAAVAAMLWVCHPASVHKVAGIAYVARSRREEIRIQGQDDFGMIQVILAANHLPERHFRAKASAVLPNRLVLVPLGFGVLGQQIFKLLCHRGGGDGLAQYS